MEAVEGQQAERLHICIPDARQAPLPHCTALRQTSSLPPSPANPVYSLLVIWAAHMVKTPRVHLRRLHGPALQLVTPRAGSTSAGSNITRLRFLQKRDPGHH